MKRENTGKRHVEDGREDRTPTADLAKGNAKQYIAKRGSLMSENDN